MQTQRQQRDSHGFTESAFLLIQHNTVFILFYFVTHAKIQQKEGEKYLRTNATRKTQTIYS